MKIAHFLAVGFVFALIIASPAISDADMVTNGDFEANAGDFVQWPGYVGGSNPAAIAGWVGSGGIGINGPGASGTPFGGTSTWNTTHYAFMQGDASLEQEISGFQIGAEYTVSMDFNSRSGFVYPVVSALLNDVQFMTSSPGTLPAIQTLTGNNATSWFHLDHNFIADAETIILKFVGAPPAGGGDVTWTVDNVMIEQQVPEPASAILLLIGGASALLVLRRRSRN